MESAGSVDTTSQRSQSHTEPRPDPQARSLIAANAAAEEAAAKTLQASDLSYALYNATGRTLVYDLETLCRRCHENDGSKTGYRRANNLLVWVIIIAVLLAYAILHG